ncbi:MAG: sugar phosphate isomerase/epimerase [Clostridiales bacterium]|jgi:fatty-acyl-CoA synthase|nr:sugar phosphate isomerase/epimerase [Clostridiales bacterium]
MKLSFSTLGCPNWTWGEIISVAKDLNYDGIELRGLGEEIFLPNVNKFSDENIAVTRSELSRNNIGISCISTEVCLQNKEDYKKLESYIELAGKLGVPYIRVLGDAAPAPGSNVDGEAVFAALKKHIPLAREKNVVMLIETNGIYANSETLRGLIERLDSEQTGVLWDINHPVRFFNEEPGETFENIGFAIRHVHLKDSVFENGKISYKMLGYGTLPIKPALKLLKDAGYNGYLSLEWTKRWDKELEDAGIVFSHFAYMARRLWNEA